MMSDFPHIPGYRIERELGRGGMAVVYLGHEAKLDRMVAIKVVELLNPQSGDQAERFLREARTAARLQHSNIVPIYNVGRIGPYYYMVVEYLSGGTLRNLLNAGPIPGGALQVVEKLAHALHYAHSQGFIHRDVKPENIMFRQDGTPVLSDFGIAWAMDTRTRLTQAGKSVGTPHYMSPEQARGLDIDGRADLYSLGVVFYEMLTGEVPYESQDNIAVAIKHIQDPIPGLPSNLAHFQPLLEKMMAKNRETRVQSGDELLRIIQEMESQDDLWPGMSAEKDDPSGLTMRLKPENDVLRQDMRNKAGESGKKPHRIQKILVGSLAGAFVVIAALLFMLLGRGDRESPLPAAGPSQEGDAAIEEKTAALLDMEYSQYMSKARTSLDQGDLEDARMKVALAKTIRKGGVEAESLKELIDKAESARQAERRRRDQARLAAERTRQVETLRKEELGVLKADDAAWGIASSLGTEEALKTYLQDYPTGRHVAEARRRIEAIQTAAPVRSEEEDAQKGRGVELVSADPPEPAVSVGDLVPLSSVDIEPQVIKSNQPAYPESARRFRIEGTVIVEMLVSETGEVTDVRVLQGIDGYPAFERAVDSAVRKWLFHPGVKDGVRVKVWRAQAFVFKTDR